MTNVTTIKDVCSICSRPLDVGHNNAEPVNHGRCCNDCNETVVIPARLRRAALNLPIRQVARGWL